MQKQDSRVLCIYGSIFRHLKVRTSVF